MTKKVCSICKKEKNLNAFRRDRSRSDGRQSWCAICARTYNQSAYMKRYKHKVKLQNAEYSRVNSERIYQYKLTHPCVNCKETDPICLTFHHLDKSKKDFGLHQRQRSWASIEKEIAKCVILCSNCHLKVHAGKIILGT